MNRLVLLRCGLFGAASYKEIAVLLGCLGARTLALKANASLYSDRIVVVLSGCAAANGRRYGESDVILSDGYPRSVEADADCELLLISPRRIQELCRNACFAHRAALKGLVRLSMESEPIPVS